MTHPAHVHIVTADGTEWLTEPFEDAGDDPTDAFEAAGEAWIAVRVRGTTTRTFTGPATVRFARAQVVAVWSERIAVEPFPG